MENTAMLRGKTLRRFVSVEPSRQGPQLPQGQGNPLFPTYTGAQVSKEQLVRAWQNNLNPRMSGHSARRSGAMMYTRKGLGIYDISFLGRWKSSAVLRYIEDALEEMPLNRARATDRATAVSKEVLPVQANIDEVKQEKKRKRSEQPHEVRPEPENIANHMPLEPPIDKSQLFAVSTSAKGKVRHTVANAGWGIPLDKWKTTCGWPFARYHVRVELTKYKTGKAKECMKCRDLEAGRDKVRGGWKLAQSIDL